MAAEEILAEQGFEDFTITAVAERSKTSVGAVYRRFDSKEKLVAALKDRILTRIESEVGNAIRMAPQHDLASAVSAFVHILASSFSTNGQVVPNLLAPSDGASSERGLQAIATLHRLFLDAVAPRLGEIHRPDPMTAMILASRTLIGACIHRSAVIRALPDGISWQSWADQLTDMTVQYLTSPSAST